MKGLPNNWEAQNKVKVTYATDQQWNRKTNSELIIEA